MVDSFEGGVGGGGSGDVSVRARVAIHGSSLEALTREKTFRVPLARCSLESAGRRVLVRDEQNSLVIWSEDEGFLDALERAQRGTLADQVRRLRRAARRKRLVKGCSVALIAAGVMGAASVPITRWAVDGGVPPLANGIGESALERLALQQGLAPTVEHALRSIAERLRPETAPSARSFHLLLADYAEVHSFSMPPGTVVVTAGLVCEADGPEVVIGAVARELAHLERQDTMHRVAEAVDYHTELDIVHGDVSTLRARARLRRPQTLPRVHAGAEGRGRSTGDRHGDPRRSRSERYRAIRARRSGPHAGNSGPQLVEGARRGV